MSTDVSQVGVTLFFLTFLSFHLSRLSFYINNTGESVALLEDMIKNVETRMVLDDLRGREERKLDFG